LAIVQLAVSCPAHAPLQLAKLKLATGAAVNVTLLPALPVMLHAALAVVNVVQLVGVALASVAFTDPLPAVVAVIDSGTGTKVAVALTAAVGLLIVQVAVSCPAHEPLQLPKVKLATTELAVIVTVSVPMEVTMLHPAPAVVAVVQLGGSALGSLAVTEPFPLVATLTVSTTAACATGCLDLPPPDGVPKFGGTNAVRIVGGTATLR
jgi:hypothetical protein